MKQRYVDLYMDLAKRISDMSVAERLKVGCVVVKDNAIISFGWNGTPSGWDNRCEQKDWMPADAPSQYSEEEIQTIWPYVEYSDFNPDAIINRYRLKTKPEVLHAERNALDKLAKSNTSGDKSFLFVTHSPCLECAKSIYGTGISHVFYRENYRSDDGIEFLKKCGVDVTKVS